MLEDRPILQKGDNFRVEGERQPLRYVQQRLAAKSAVGSPQANFIMEPVEPAPVSGDAASSARP